MVVPASGTAPYALLDGSGDIVTTRLDDLLGPRMSSSQPAKPRKAPRLKPSEANKPAKTPAINPYTALTLPQSSISNP